MATGHDTKAHREQQKERKGKRSIVYHTMQLFRSWYPYSAILTMQRISAQIRKKINKPIVFLRQKQWDKWNHIGGVLVPG